MTTIGVSRDALNSVEQAYNDFMCLLNCMTDCIEQEQIPFTDRLEWQIQSFHIFPTDEVRIARTLKSSIEKSELGACYTHWEFAFACIDVLREVHKKVNSVAFADELRTNLLSISRDGVEVQYLNILSLLRKKIEGSYKRINECVGVINAWKYTTKDVDVRNEMEQAYKLSYLIYRRLSSISSIISDAIQNSNRAIIQQPAPNSADQQSTLTSIDQEPVPTEPGKSSKKRNPTGWKHQLIMLNELGLLNAGKLERLNDSQKAKVLALLLNRSVQDIRILLGNWKVRKDPTKLDVKYLIKEHHEESVKEWLLDLGVLI